MVRAFLLLALGGPGPPGTPRTPGPPGTDPPCRLLYARTFRNPPGNPPESPERQRLRRKEQLLAVGRQVASQCQLLQAASGRSPPPHPLPEGSLSLQEAPGGVFQLPPGDLFPQRTRVTWLSFLALAFALICDPEENLSLAEITLRRLAPRLMVALRVLGSGAEVLLRPDAADGLLDHLLPQGQMMFLNQGLLQALDRELGRKTSQ
ncbi:AP-5 complex subunit sigma-1 [Calypte anna]|nr:AP-5 complex subunit sigma-1 [Calypte anna]